MKKFVMYLCLALAMLISVPATSAGAQSTQRQQEADQTVTIRRGDLTPDQIAALDKKAFDAKVETYGKWVGVGHELGVAVNESLSAVTTQANNFAQTGVGKWTIALVIWKVAGHDLIAFAIGIFLLLVGIPVWIWAFYKNCLTHRVLTSVTKEGEKTWTIVNQFDVAKTPRNSKGETDINPLTMTRFWHLLALFLFGVFDMIVMFS